MKWPETLTLVRHDTSAYNHMKAAREVTPQYQAFKKAYGENPDSDESRRRAIEIKEEFSLPHGDHDTPLAPGENNYATKMAETLKTMIDLPDVVFVSPYLRTKLTLERMTWGWPELSDVRTVEEDRIIEQDHGLVLVYNDWRIFNTLHPEQRELRKIQGGYWYRYPQGENVPDVRERLRSWIGTITRDFNNKNILAVTHHLAILSLRANLERLNEAEFMRLDQEEKPINAGVTIYRGNPNLGSDGKLMLDVYNQRLY